MSDVVNRAALIVGALALCYLLWRRNPDALNPLSDKNLFNQGADAVTKNLSGGKYLSLGGALFGETAAERDINKPVTQAEIDAYRNGRGAGDVVSDPLETVSPFMVGA